MMMKMKMKMKMMMMMMMMMGELRPTSSHPATSSPFADKQPSLLQVSWDVLKVLPFWLRDPYLPKVLARQPIHAVTELKVPKALKFNDGFTVTSSEGKLLDSAKRITHALLSPLVNPMSCHPFNQVTSPQ